jgi:hypothetical protein
MKFHLPDLEIILCIFFFIVNPRCNRLRTCNLTCVVNDPGFAVGISRDVYFLTIVGTYLPIIITGISSPTGRLKHAGECGEPDCYIRDSVATRTAHANDQRIFNVMGICVCALVVP